MIRFSNVSKHFRTQQHRKTILDRVSVEFQQGYSYGILGVNGAGKSTTMRIIAGTMLPNGGRIWKDLRVSWPLGFSGGFHPAMTGRENLNFVARAYGENVRRVASFVEDFAELGDYINAPVRTYSSGMGARLAFGLSMAIEFDCYLVDEITAVGDARFQKKCRDAFENRRKNADIIMISHSMDTIKSYCDKGMLLVDGRLMVFDKVDEAIETYYRLNR
ncbi:MULTISPECIES: ABC transporter ATP-binding protein [unclassified Shinella]|uniref:ABC transporter ATP-binding protein n=1 Tax=unclassified Shinella TaxID=2643062 RepID=UPI00225CE8E2|nr:MULTISPECIES: ABC transporter ATP-binding protein [unclassified Shinella]MCO5153684.1 ABC transporter ATP-binding protein [Shinella sp.]MDC7259941.1 ABC transporter ATP-binding protein [Shinella sp. YE25]CAI0341707.1 Capsule polysaccharide export ATP-binding protein CtrD [Rhizobiaceae bacterium]CAK7262023.1 Capsule polysaccharide export ATP-binding protein CtrD [Shinella sp. WSC3-e]